MTGYQEKTKYNKRSSVSYYRYFKTKIYWKQTLRHSIDRVKILQHSQFHKIQSTDSSFRQSILTLKNAFKTSLNLSPVTNWAWKTVLMSINLLPKLTNQGINDLSTFPTTWLRAASDLDLSFLIHGIYQYVLAFFCLENTHQFLPFSYKFSQNCTESLHSWGWKRPLEII